MTLEVMSPTAALLDGRYVLHDRVGRGGMATVYRAEDSHLGRTVAIKMIHEGEGPIASIERAHTEKALLASLSHPSLVTLHDAQLAPGRPQYLVMEFVDGPTLAERMAAGPLPPRDVARIARDLAEGLAAVHAAGIVHRDVKPSNVLLAKGRSGRPIAAKLADFGIACSVENPRLTTPGIVLGTLTYMAPEQLRDLDPGTPVDVFALGLVMLEALTGEPGYPSLMSGRAAAIARLAEPPTISETVPEEWRDLLARMTRLEPSERPAADEVARGARSLLRGYSANNEGTAVAAAAAAIVASAGTTPALADAAGAARAAETPELATAAQATVAMTRSDAAARPSTRAGSASTEATAVLSASEEPTAADATGPRPITGSRTRNRVIAGAAGLAATGALVVGLAAFTTPTADIGRIASGTLERTAAVPADAVPEEAPAAPVEVVSDRGTGGNPGNSGNNGNSGNPGNSGNSGNNGNSGNSGNNGNSGKGGNGNSGKN